MALAFTTPGNDCRITFSTSNSREIPFFKDLRKIRTLAGQPLDPELKEQLKSRGADFVKLKGTHYLEYHDSVYQRRNFGLESRILKFRVSSFITNLMIRRSVERWWIAPLIRK